MEYKPLTPGNFKQITLTDIGMSGHCIYTFCYPNQVCIVRSNPDRKGSQSSRSRWSFLDDGSVLVYSYEGYRLSSEIDGVVIESTAPLIKELRDFVASYNIEQIVENIE